MSLYNLLASHAGPVFNWNSLWPVVILLAISSFVPIILAVLKLKMVPVFVIEIIAGLILASIPAVRDLFIYHPPVDTQSNGYVLGSLSEGLYMIGMAILLFLSGLDTDYSVLHPAQKKGHRLLNVFGISWFLFLLVIICSFIAALFFQKYLIPEHTVIGIILLTIIFSSTFASVVIPIVHECHDEEYSIGKLVCTYSTIAEFISIFALSTLMIIREMVAGSQPALLIIVLIILFMTYIIKRFVPKNIFKEKMEGFVHLSMRLTMLVLLLLVIVTNMSGAEFILGAFLAGMVIKASNISKPTMKKFETIGYGVFVPMFYVLVGFKVGLTMPIADIFKWENLSLILILFVVLLLVKIPFLLLSYIFKLKTVISTIFVVSTTLIVAIAAEHFGLFVEGNFFGCLVAACCLTCLIPPVIFEINNSYGYCHDKWEEWVITPNDFIQNKQEE